MELLNDIENYVRNGQTSTSLTKIEEKVATESSENIEKMLMKVAALSAEYQECLEIRRKTHIDNQPKPKHALSKNSELGVSAVFGLLVYQLAESNCPSLLFSGLAAYGAYQSSNAGFGVYHWWQQRTVEKELNSNIAYLEARQNVSSVKTRIGALNTIFNKAYAQAIQTEKAAKKKDEKITNTALTK